MAVVRVGPKALCRRRSRDHDRQREDEPETMRPRAGGGRPESPSTAFRRPRRFCCSAGGPNRGRSGARSSWCVHTTPLREICCLAVDLGTDGKMPAAPPSPCAERGSPAVGRGARQPHHPWRAQAAGAAAATAQGAPRRPRCRAAAAAAAEQQPPQQLLDRLEPLKAWIAAAGGRVHPALCLAEQAPSSGCRGIVAAAPIPLADLEAHGAPVRVPAELQLRSARALELARRAGGEAAAEAAAARLTDAQLVAAALAAELAAGGGSPWWPYLQTLPAAPPNPWLLGDAQLAAELEPLAAARGAAAVAGWAAAAARERRAMLGAAAEAAAAMGAAALGGADADAVLLALGHVASRSLTGGRSSSGLVPFVDLVNHSAAARPPMLQLDDDDRLATTVLPIRDDEAVPLAAGEELLICYSGGGYCQDPLAAWLKFGFVADEWWGAGGEE